MIFAESLTNALIGLLVSWAATYWVLGYSPAGSLGVTLMFAGLSFARSYAVRWAFSRLDRQHHSSTGGANAPRTAPPDAPVLHSPRIEQSKSKEQNA